VTLVDAPATAMDLAEVCAYVLEKVGTAMIDCDRPEFTTSFIAAGLIAWDDCCGMLVVAPERVFRTATFPLEGADPFGCYQGLVAVSLVVLCVRCVPTLDDEGRPPSAQALGDAYGEVMADAAVAWNALGDGAWPDGWEWANESQSFTGAEGGCIGVETRVTLGLDQEQFCPC